MWELNQKLSFNICYRCTVNLYQHVKSAFPSHSREWDRKGRSQRGKKCFFQSLFHQSVLVKYLINPMPLYLSLSFSFCSNATRMSQLKTNKPTDVENGFPTTAALWKHICSVRTGLIYYPGITGFTNIYLDSKGTLHIGDMHLLPIFIWGPRDLNGSVHMLQQLVSHWQCWILEHKYWLHVNRVYLTMDLSQGESQVSDTI